MGRPRKEKKVLMKLNVNITPQMYNRFKLVCSEEQMSMSTVIKLFVQSFNEYGTKILYRPYQGGETA